MCLCSRRAGLSAAGRQLRRRSGSQAILLPRRKLPVCRARGRDSRQNDGIAPTGEVNVPVARRSSVVTVARIANVVVASGSRNLTCRRGTPCAVGPLRLTSRIVQFWPADRFTVTPFQRSTVSVIHAVGVRLLSSTRHRGHESWKRLLTQGCVKTRRGIIAPEISSPVVVRRAKKCNNSCSARYYDQITFSFHIAWTHSGY
jgi:hypothetical protein